MAETPTPTPTPRPSGGPPPQGTRGLGAVIGGSIVAFLAPLFGFLGGSMVGSSGGGSELDPLYLWLAIGLMVGAVGAGVAIMGALRWVRSRRPSSGAARPG